MYLKSSVEVFLLQRRVKPSIISEIQARMAELADKNGAFLASELDYIMDAELAETYRQAVDKNPSLLIQEEYQHWRPEDSRHLSGEVIL